MPYTPAPVTVYGLLNLTNGTLVTDLYGTPWLRPTREQAESGCGPEEAVIELVVTHRTRPTP